jgi:hypothetical protein
MVSGAKPGSSEPLSSLGCVRRSSWGVKSPEAIIYHPIEDELVTQKLEEAESKPPPRRIDEMKDSDESGTSGLIRVDLPHWANRVDIYMDGKEKTGFIASVKMKRLGAKKNWQRHLGYNYTHMFVLAPQTQVIAEG